MPPQPLSTSTRPPRSAHRMLLTLALLYTAYRNRKPLLSRLHAFTRAFKRAAHAANLLSLVLSQTTSDVHYYLHPPPRARAAAPPVPRSLRRLLRLAATPDALAVLRHLSAGAARAVVSHEMHASPRMQQDNGTRTGEGVSVRPPALHALMEALAAPAGRAVVSNVVATAVREAVSAASDVQGRTNGHGTRAWPDVLADALLSDRGQRLVVDVATSVTRAAVPAVVRAAAEEDRADVRGVPGVRASSPVASPLIRRKRSAVCGSPLPKAPGAVTASVEGSPVTKQLVLSMMRAQGRQGLVERLALLAIRDRALVREVVRTVVSEAVRTYLTTQEELRMERGGENRPAISGADAKSGARSCGKERDGGGGGTGCVDGAAGESEVQKDGAQLSLWRLLIRSAVVDVKRALVSRGASDALQPGWLIF